MGEPETTSRTPALNTSDSNLESACEPVVTDSGTPEKLPGPPTGLDAPAAPPADAYGSGAAPVPQEAPTPDTSHAPPPGYLWVTVLIDGRQAITDLPVEVLPCHTFTDVCAAALAHVPGAPESYAVQAFLLLEASGPAPASSASAAPTSTTTTAAAATAVPLQDPDTPARPTLRSFPAVTRLRFVVLPPGTAGAGGGRTVKAVARGGARRGGGRARLLRRVARVAVGFAKFVMVVEAAALLRGGLAAAARHARRAAGWGGGSSDGSYDDSEGGGGGRYGGVGSATEAAMDDVAEFVAGRGQLGDVTRHEPGRVVGALEAMDTEVLEQLDVPDVPAARAAVRGLLQQLTEARQQQQQQQAAQQAAAAQGPGADGGGGSRGAERAAAGEAAAAAAAAQPEALPGFGPPGAAAGSGKAQ